METVERPVDVFEVVSQSDQVADHGPGLDGLAALPERVDVAGEFRVYPIAQRGCKRCPAMHVGSGECWNDLSIEVGELLQNVLPVASERLWVDWVAKICVEVDDGNCDVGGAFNLLDGRKRRNAV